MRFESYAQEFEDLILYCALKDVTGGGADGFYIDVGANDPTEISVTKFFYDHGWHGINIEPLPDKCALLIEQRPRDINLCVGLGKETGKINLIGDNTGATFSNEVAEDWKFPAKRRLKKILTLSEVHERYCDPKQDIHFCKIDVEGFEREVLEGIKDWKKFRPWIFAIESTLPGTAIPCHDKWEDILLKNDYTLAFNFGINRYYIDIEREYLMQGFQKVGQFVAQNEIVKMVMQRVSFK